MKTSMLQGPWKKPAAALMAAATLIFMGCYYAPGTSGDSARAKLVVSKAVVPNISSIAVVVEGPGMNTISASFPAAASEVKIDVPPGHARKFTLLMNSPSATLQGTATVDLNPGEDREITLEPSLAATEIVVPDRLNNRIVQVSDLDFTGWTPITNTNFLKPDTFYPYDIDFDSLGRIYIANYNGTTSSLGAVMRIDDIQHAAEYINVDLNTMNVNSVAVDRTNGYVYYADSGTLYRKRVGEDYTTAPASFPLSGEAQTSGMTLKGIGVDDEGMVYMVLDGATSALTSVVKFNPSLAVGSRVAAVDAGYPFGTNASWDVMVKGQYVYVSFTSGNRIVRFDRNLQFVDYYQGPAATPLGNPRTFLATANRMITVIEDVARNRISSFEYLTGAGWMTLGTASGGGSGINQFDFFVIN